jgi:hypothetical protein
MYVDGLLLFVIYFIAVLAAAVSVYALWSLEEVRKHYQRMYNQKTKMYVPPKVTTKPKRKGHWD